MFQGCSEVVPDCSGLLWGCSGDVTGCSGMFRGVPGCSGAVPGFYRHPRTGVNFQLCTFTQAVHTSSLILFTHVKPVKFTPVRTSNLRNSGNQPLETKREGISDGFGLQKNNTVTIVFINAIFNRFRMKILWIQETHI